MPKDKKQVPSAVVAKYFLKLAKRDDPPRPFTPLKLLKLTYLAHGWAYAGLNKRLISDPVEAWTYGPVFPDLYHILKKYGSDPVKKISLKDINAVIDENNKIKLNRKEKKVIKIIYNAYKKMSASKLVSITHEKNSPWDITKEKFSYYWNREIDQDLIRKHFENQLVE